MFSIKHYYNVYSHSIHIHTVKTSLYPVSILYKSITGRYYRVADGPITARCRFIKNASWVNCLQKIKVNKRYRIRKTRRYIYIKMFLFCFFSSNVVLCLEKKVHQTNVIRFFIAKYINLDKLHIALFVVNDIDLSNLNSVGQWQKCLFKYLFLRL